MGFYLNTHIPMVMGLLGDAVKGSAIEEGLGGAGPGDDAPFAAIGSIFFDSMEDFESAFGPNAGAIMGDITNFTNMEPVVQISEVMV